MTIMIAAYPRSVDMLEQSLLARVRHKYLVMVFHG